MGQRRSIREVLEEDCAQSRAEMGGVVLSMGAQMPTVNMAFNRSDVLRTGEQDTTHTPVDWEAGPVWNHTVEVAIDTLGSSQEDGTLELSRCAGDYCDGRVSRRWCKQDLGSATAVCCEAGWKGEVDLLWTSSSKAC